MANRILNQQRFNGGIAVSEKEGVPGSFAFGLNLDIHQDPTRFTLSRKPTKVSGSVVTGLVKWIVKGTPYDTNTYAYDANGVIYKEDSGGTWTVLRTVSNSHGQGMCVFQDYLYYVQDSQIGRYGPLDGSPSFTDNWQTGLTNTSATGFAPVTPFYNGIVVGHGNLMGFYDGTTWTAAKLTLPPGVNIRTLAQLQEYIVLGTWRSSSGSIQDSEEGYLFFWDGSALVANMFVIVPEGACNAIVNVRNHLLGIMGSAGLLYEDQLVYQNDFEKLQTFPKLKPQNYVEVYPGAITNWRGKTYYAVANTDSTDIVGGIYEWGSISNAYQEVLNCPFTISTGNTGSTVKFGALAGFGRSMYIGWQDGTSYGVDKVSTTSSYATSGYMETFIFDNGQSYKDKAVLVERARHFALNSGESVLMSYKKDRASSYTDGIVHSYSANDVDPTETRLNIPDSDSRCNEWQIKVTLGSGGTTAPTVTSLSMQFDDLKEEGNF